MAKIMPVSVTRKVKASTILEVVISMVIIVFVIGIALMILTNVLRLSLSVKQLKASSILQQEMNKAKAIDIVSNEVLQINDWRVEKTFKPFSIKGALLEADFTIYDQNNVKITELKSVIIHETK